VGETDAVPLIAVSQLPSEGNVFFSAPSSGDGEGFRVLARARGDFIDITAAPLDEVYDTTRELIAIQAAAIAAVLAGLSLVAVWVIRLGITPMRRMVAASAAIAEGDLDVRLEGAASGSESAELAASLNTMIENLTEAIAVRERSESRLRAFVADASHELRTPLTTVLGYAELYRRGALKRKREVADAWARTEAEAARMRRLVNDMLELATYDAEPELNLTEVNLLALARDVAADARVAHPDASMVVEGEPSTVMGDADRLRQALINVLGNALEHGGSAVSIAVSSSGLDATVVVTDNGPGMPPEVAIRATERFVRGDASRSRSRGGAGLGLAIAEAILRTHNGVLDLTSTVGVGTTVTLALPRVTESDSP
jgi:two-component system OmpR family sensor kinase